MSYRVVFAFFWIFWTALAGSQAFELKRGSVPSKAMGRSISVSMLVPDGYRNSSKPVPVVYLLHGFADDDTAWPERTKIGELADQYGVLVVCPDGDNSWYFDSPEVPEMQFETFVSDELVKFVDDRFKTIKGPKGRAITGLSMGGHGAMFLAIRHPDVFGAVGSMSGGVDIRPFPNEWEIKRAIGTIEEHPERWEELTVINQARSLKDGQLAIAIECGVDDFFIDVNRALHQQLLEQKVAHDYTERPGRHDWDYWRNAIDYQMLFFSKFFDRADG